MSGHWEPAVEWVEDDPEDDDYRDAERDEYEEQEEENERLSACTCGAYVWSMKRGKFVHVADCICGNT